MRHNERIHVNGMKETHMKNLILTSTAALTLAACSTTGNLERNALIGSGSGAAIGAIVGNNAGSGNAARGAAIGASAGALAGLLMGPNQNRAQTQGQYRHGQYSHNQIPYRTSQHHGDQHHGHAHQRVQYSQPQTHVQYRAQPCQQCPQSAYAGQGHAQYSSRPYSSRSTGQSTGHSAASNGLSYDQFSGRYYSTDASGNTFWQNGSPRTTRGY